MENKRNRLMPRKLPPGYVRVVMPFILSIFMSAIVSAVATVTSVGLGPRFALTWSNAWSASWLVAFPALLFILPIVRRIVAIFVEQPREACRRPIKAEPAGLPPFPRGRGNSRGA